MKVRERRRTDNKADGSPVTEADLAADRIIIDGLVAIAPDIPAITEETYVPPIMNRSNTGALIRLTAPRVYQWRRRFHRQYCPDHRPCPTLGVIYAPALAFWAG